MLRSADVCVDGNDNNAKAARFAPCAIARGNNNAL